MAEVACDLVSGKCRPCEDGVPENDFIRAAKLDALLEL